MEPVLGIFNKETFKKGMKAGIEKGMHERNHEIMLKMLDKGLNTKAISSYTGLSEKNIKSIKSKPKNGYRS